jgi:hypothetical protein
MANKKTAVMFTETMGRNMILTVGTWMDFQPPVGVVLLPTQGSPEILSATLSKTSSHRSP